jgi:hypothetical protein
MSTKRLRQRAHQAAPRDDAQVEEAVNDDDGV